MKFSSPGSFLPFLLIALLAHALGYSWILHHQTIKEPTRDSLVPIHLLQEIPVPVITPKSKPRPRPHISKPSKKIRLARSFHGVAISAPAKTSSKSLTSWKSKGVPASNPDETAESLSGGGKTSQSFPVVNPTPPAPQHKDPLVLVRCQPDYPEAEREEGIEGTVQILVVVGKGGKAKEIRIASSSGSPNLDQTAVRSVRECWRFSPAFQNGQEVESRLTFPITFQISQPR